MKKIRVCVLALSVTAGVALGQNLPTGVVRGGILSLARTESKLDIGLGAPIDTTTDFVSGSFISVDYTNYMFPTPPTPTIVGPCIVTTSTTSPSAPPTLPPVTYLDAGPALNVNGPNGAQQIPKGPYGYGAQVGGGTPLPYPIPGVPGPTPLYLDPGTYTLDNGGGGADVGAFTATLTIPAPAFTWTNADAVPTVVRSAGVDIQWIGGDPAGQVTITGNSTTIDPTTSQPTGAVLFQCTVPNTGDYVVTSDVLTLLPPSTVISGVSSSLLTVGSGVQTSVSAPGIDTTYSMVSFSTSFSRNVVFQ